MQPAARDSTVSGGHAATVAQVTVRNTGFQGGEEAKDPATPCLFPDTRSQAWGCPPPEPPQSREWAGSRAALTQGQQGGEERRTLQRSNATCLS